MKKRTNEIVHLSLRQLKNGNERYYIDYRYNGKRYREFLTNLILRTPKSGEDRAYNINVKLQAEAIRTQRESEILNGTFGTEKAKQSNKRNALLLDVLELYREEKERTGQSKSVPTTIKNLMHHLEKYQGKEVKIKNIDVDFCNGFVDYLAHAKTFGTGKVKGKGETKQLSKTTAKLYFDTFICALNFAVDLGYIANNPINRHTVNKKPITPIKKSRGYLSVDEVFKLIDTPCKQEEVKKAFLFGCFCGLRFSDVVNLKWGNIRKEGNAYKLDVTMKKTENNIVLTLNSYALQCLPERGKAKAIDNIFHLSDNSTVNKELKKWVKETGINKDISFHISRHTFATMLLTSGADVMTVSKLLGHKNVRTTQIYAEVIDAKKDEAVNNLARLMDKEKEKKYRK